MYYTFENMNLFKVKELVGKHVAFFVIFVFIMCFVVSFRSYLRLKRIVSFK